MEILLAVFTVVYVIYYELLVYFRAVIDPTKRLDFFSWWNWILSFSIIMMLNVFFAKNPSGIVLPIHFVFLSFVIYKLRLPKLSMWNKIEVIYTLFFTMVIAVVTVVMNVSYIWYSTQ